MTYLLSKLYEWVVRSRLSLYRRGVLASQGLNNPVISIGNLTVGGTGKTPLVCFLAQTLKKAGYQPIILSRGYKRKDNSPVLLVSDGKKILCNAQACGDEPFLMAEKLEGVPVVVGKSRYQAGRLIENDYERVVHLLDDGYQHVQLKRDWNILVLDATDPFGGNRLLPSGRLREPLRELRRADSVLITRSHVADDPDELELQIRRWNKIVPISHFHHDITGLLDLNTRKQSSVRSFFGKRVIAMAGIGNPKLFLRDLEHYQMTVLSEFIFRDHHQYTQPQLDRVMADLDESGAHCIVTTEKDAVRLRDLTFGESRIFAAQIEMQPEEPVEYKKSFLDEVAFSWKQP